uniref:Uncharacterized protein n=1 Tax=Cucumis melo TaxID=3656 RepID=A0A9I9E6W0_CUCME
MGTPLVGPSNGKRREEVSCILKKKKGCIPPYEGRKSRGSRYYCSILTKWYPSTKTWEDRGRWRRKLKREYRADEFANRKTAPTAASNTEVYRRVEEYRNRFDKLLAPVAFLHIAVLEETFMNGLSRWLKTEVKCLELVGLAQMMKLTLKIENREMMRKECGLKSVYGGNFPFNLPTAKNTITNMMKTCEADDQGFLVECQAVEGVSVNMRKVEAHTLLEPSYLKIPQSLLFPCFFRRKNKKFHDILGSSKMLSLTNNGIWIVQLIVAHQKPELLELPLEWVPFHLMFPKVVTISLRLHKTLTGPSIWLERKNRILCDKCTIDHCHFLLFNNIHPLAGLFLISSHVTTPYIMQTKIRMICLVPQLTMPFVISLIINRSYCLASLAKHREGENLFILE